MPFRYRDRISISSFSSEFDHHSVLDEPATINLLQVLNRGCWTVFFFGIVSFFFLSFSFLFLKTCVVCVSRSIRIWRPSISHGDILSTTHIPASPRRDRNTARLSRGHHRRRRDDHGRSHRRLPLIYPRCQLVFRRRCDTLHDHRSKDLGRLGRPHSQQLPVRRFPPLT